MILAQPTFVATQKPRALGQFVTTAARACELAIQDGTTLDVQALATATAKIYIEMVKALPPILSALQIPFLAKARLMQGIATEASGHASGTPARGIFGDRAEMICAAIAQADSDADQFPGSAPVRQARAELFSFSEGILDRIARGELPSVESSLTKSNLLVPAMFTGALLLVIGGAFYFAGRR